MDKIINRLINLFETADWIDSGVYDEAEESFIILTVDNEGFALKYIDSELKIILDEEDAKTKALYEEFFKTHTMEDFKNMVKELFKKNRCLGYMIFTLLELHELKIIDKYAMVDLATQISLHKEEIDECNKRFNSWLE